MYIPEGYGTVFPYMIVDDADQLKDFLAAVFVATEVGRTTMPDGRIANLRLRIGTSQFMIGESDKENFPSMPAAYYVYISDVDETFCRALDHGATSIFEPDDMPYGDRQAGVRDPSGNLWWISRRLIDHSYDP